MDTQSFLSHILPEQGFKFVVMREAADKPWIHKPARSIEEVAAIARRADAAGRAVYHACASFKEPFVLSATKKYEDGSPKREYRKHENAGWAKALWLDLDCGEDKGYPDQKAALADILRFSKAAGIPRPLIVSSGYGLHCYWVFDREISAVHWSRLAMLWRGVCNHFGVKHDSSRTSDVSSVLRPVGTHNRKVDGVEREVKVIGGVPAVIPITDLVVTITTLIKNQGIEVRQIAPQRNAALNNDLSGGMEYPPSSAHEIANHCAQVRDFRDVKGNVDEPLWYAMLGLLKHTVEAEEICHAWSEGHPEYDYDVTHAKVEQWTHGPTLCTKFETLRPEGCAACPHAEKIKSPIQLGVTLPEPEAIEPEVNAETGETEEIPELPERLARRYAWSGGKMSMLVRGEDGVQELVPFCTMFLYPKQYSRDHEGHVYMTWIVREKPGRFKQFELSGAVISVGGRDLLSKLGEQGIVCVPGGKKIMEQYITEWFNELRGSVDEVDAYATFGWHRDAFLLGNTLITPDGAETVVRVQGDADRYAKAFEPRGTLEGWVDRVNAIYNRPGHEQFQWMMGTSFGAPLVRMIGGGMAGCVVNGYSSESGVGKSTAGMVGLAIYGDPGALMLAKNQATVRGLFAYIGVMKSLPILLDEVTNTKGYEFSDLVYTFSNGTGRIGAQSDGSLRANVYGWATLMATTSNRAIQSTLAAAKINATPEIARVFEYKFQRAGNQMGRMEADEMLPALMENTGHAGRAYLRYVVTHQDEVRIMLAKMRKIITKRARMAQEERFWLAGMSTIMTGLAVAKRIGLVKFDLDALLAWAVDQVGSMRALVNETETDVIDQFGVMLNSLSTGFLVTDKEGDARGKDSRAQVLHAPRGELAGRVVKIENVLYLPVSVMRHWCSEHQADYREMTAELTKRGWASIEPKLVSLGKGTSDYATAPSRCYRINLNLAGGELAIPQESQPELRAVK